MNLVIVTLVVIAFTLAAFVLLSKRDRAADKTEPLLAPIENKKNRRKDN